MDVLGKIDTDYLSVEEERELTARALAGDEDPRNRVVMNIYPWIIGRANKYAGRIPHEDLVQHAVDACIRKFHLIDLSFESRPKTYLTNVAERQMQRLTRTYGVIARPACDRYNLRDPETIRRADAANKLGSLSAPMRRRDGSLVEVGDMVEGPDPDPAEVAATNELNARAMAMLRFLPNERDREIVKLRIFESMTLQEVGDAFGLTRERIRQIEVRALQRIREEMTGKRRPKVRKARKKALAPA